MRNKGRERRKEKRGREGRGEACPTNKKSFPRRCTESCLFSSSKWRDRLGYGGIEAPTACNASF